MSRSFSQFLKLWTEASDDNIKITEDLIQKTKDVYCNKFLSMIISRAVVIAKLKQKSEVDDDDIQEAANDLTTGAVQKDINFHGTNIMSAFEIWSKDDSINEIRFESLPTTVVSSQGLLEFLEDDEEMCKVAEAAEESMNSVKI